MKYSIIFCTYNRLPYLKNLITSIEKYTVDYELIVIDAGSTDGTREWLKEQSFQSIFPSHNVAVADGWNLGCILAKGTFIQILNDDMEVTEGWLDANRSVYEVLESKGEKIGVLQSQIWFNGEIQSRGGAFRGTTLVPIPSPDEIKIIDYSNTPFFRRVDYWEVGGFTAFSVLYYEDPDFALKLQRKGYQNYYNPFSVIRHETLGQLESHGQKEVERRKLNETVYQVEARKKFMERWQEWLEKEHISRY